MAGSWSLLELQGSKYYTWRFAMCYCWLIWPLKALCPKVPLQQSSKTANIPSVPQRLDSNSIPNFQTEPFLRTKKHKQPLGWVNINPLVTTRCSGASLTLTAVLCHGHGCWMYLSAGEGIGCGSGWNWECVTCLLLESIISFSLKFWIIVTLI